MGAKDFDVNSMPGGGRLYGETAARNARRQEEEDARRRQELEQEKITLAFTEDERKKQAEVAGTQQRKRSAAASGRVGRILTGSRGLGEVGEENMERKSLLGY